MRHRMRYHLKRGPRRHARPGQPGFRLESGPYRSRRGWFLGVCTGVADHFDLPVMGVRVAYLIFLPLTGFWPLLIAYIAAAFIMRPAPVVPLESEEDAEFYNSYTSSRSMALHRLRRTYDNLDRRIQRMEGIVTDREFNWEQRLNESKED